MKISKAVAVCRNVFDRVLFFYLVLTVGIYLTVDHAVVINKSMDALRHTPRPIMTYALGGGRPSERHLQQTVRYYKNFLGRFPRHARAYSALGYCYVLLGDLERAKHYYELAVISDPKQFGFYYNLGSIAFWEENFAVAASYFEKALAIPPEVQLSFQDAVLPNWPQWSKIQLDIEQKRLLALRECYAMGYEYLVWSYSQLGDHKAVLETIRHALAASGGGTARLCFLAGQAAYFLGLNTEAISFLQQSLTLGPQNSEAYDYLAKVFESQGQVALSRQAANYASKIQISGQDSKITAPPATRLFYFPPFVTVKTEEGEKLIL